VNVETDQGYFAGMIDGGARTLMMTLPKLLAAASLAALALAFLTASPGIAANGDDGVTNGAPANPADPAAKPRRHRKHQGDHRRRRQQNGNPQTAPGTVNPG
jgi:hypothetical protein